MWSSSLGSLVITWFTGGWEAATIFSWRQGWQTKSFSNFNLGNPRIKSSELNLASKSKLKWPSLLCYFQSSEEDPATKHREEPKEWEKSARKTRPKGKIWQTRFPWESRTRDKTVLKRTSKPSWRSYETKSKLKCKFKTKATSFKIKLSLTRMIPRESTLPLLLSPNVLYSLHCTRSRLENHFELLIMWRKQSESMSHVFSRPPSCINRKHGMSKWHNTGVSKLWRIPVLAHLPWKKC
jgi:hypothetical protein